MASTSRNRAEHKKQSAELDKYAAVKLHKDESFDDEGKFGNGKDEENYSDHVSSESLLNSFDSKVFYSCVRYKAFAIIRTIPLKYFVLC